MVIVHVGSETLYACVETLTEPPKVEKNGAKCSAFHPEKKAGVCDNAEK